MCCARSQITAYFSSSETVPSTYAAENKTLKSIVKKLYLTGPGPYIMFAFALAVPIIIALAYILGPGIKIDMSAESFTAKGHYVSRADDAIKAATKCTGSVECLEQKCQVLNDKSASTERHRRGFNNTDAKIAGYKHDGSATHNSVAANGLRIGLHDLWSQDNDPEESAHMRQRRAWCGVSCFSITLIYQPRGSQSNMLTPKMLQQFRKVEAATARFFYNEIGRWPNANGVDEFQSISRFIYNDAWDSLDPVLLTNDQVKERLDYASSDVGATKPGWPSPYGSAVLGFGSSPFEKQRNDDTTLDRWFTAHLRSTINVPTHPSKKALARWGDHLHSLSNVDIETNYASRKIFQYQLKHAVASDVLIAGYALAFVAFWMLLHTFSPFLTIMGILTLSLAFPPAYLIYSGVFGEEALSILTPVTLLIVIGIAIDDVFVFVDTFKQCEKGLSSELRMARTFSAAARSTLFTTVTSASAFLANYLSGIPALANFGLMTGLVIMMNYVWLVMLIPLSLGFWERHFEGWGRACCANVESTPDYEMFDQEGIEDNQATEEVQGLCMSVYKKVLRISPFAALLSTLAGVVTRHRRLVLLLYLMIFALFSGYAATLQFADKPPSMVPEGSDMEKAMSFAGMFTDYSAVGGNTRTFEAFDSKMEKRVPDNIPMEEGTFVPDPTGVCKEQQAFIQCPSAADSVRPNNSKACLELLCAAEECCEPMATCNTISEGNCGDAGMVRTNNLATTCVADCQVEECCEVLPTCEDANIMCGNRASKSQRYASGKCATLVCTFDECCEAHEQCGSAGFKCTSGETAEDGSVACKSMDCSRTECCLEHETCGVSNTTCNPSTQILALDLTSPCPSSKCRQSDCCNALQTCTNAPGMTDRCKTDGTLFTPTPDAVCSSTECKANECCFPMNCDAFGFTNCSKDHHLKDNLVQQTCVSGKGCQNSDCCGTCVSNNSQTTGLSYLFMSVHLPHVQPSASIALLFSTHPPSR